MDKNSLIKIRNRDNAAVFYDIPELNGLHRVFQPGEIKEVTLDELLKLSYTPGGMSLLKNNFVLGDKNAVQIILGKVEPEYNYTEIDVKNLLEKGSLDELLDCLDFAPEGVIELVKSMAVDLPLNDVAKREAIHPFNLLGTLGSFGFISFLGLSSIPSKAICFIASNSI